MEVSLIKDKSKKYVCAECGKQFNWNDECLWYGSPDKDPEAYFCGLKCAEKYAINKPNRK